MPRAVLSLGSNEGPSSELIAKAFASIRALETTSNVQISSLYQTSPVSDLPQRDFLNAALLLDTHLSPLALLEELEAIERALGKEPKPKNAPRPIDIDLVFYGDLELKTERLTLPHPRWKERLFVLIPLIELMGESPELIERINEVSQSSDQIVTLYRRNGEKAYPRADQT